MIDELLASPIAAGAAAAWLSAICAYIYTWCMRRRDRASFRAACGKLDETAAELAKLEARYGRYRMLDRLAGGDLAKAIVGMGALPAHWLAVGGAYLAADGDERLTDLVATKGGWLAGEFKGNYDDWVADQAVQLCNERAGPLRPLTAKERAVLAGIGSDGKAALALVIKHLSEAFPDEEPKEQAAAEYRDAAKPAA